MTWTFDENFRPQPPDGRREVFTLAEFHRQEWPACPVCGTTVDVTPVPTPTLNDRDQYIPGRWRCPRGCDPRTAESR